MNLKKPKVFRIEYWDPNVWTNPDSIVSLTGKLNYKELLLKLSEMDRKNMEYKIYIDK